jgi:hypothetical protein
MRVGPVLCALMLAALQPGCSFVHYGCQNLVMAPVDAINDCLLANRADAMANAAWADIVKEKGLGRSYYYADGFHCGFVDYIRYNGNGEPPVAPPWIYQTSGFETPDGHGAILDWFDGFRHGTAIARSTGFHEAAVILPLSQPPLYSRNREPGRERPNSSSTSAPPDELPMPRKTPPDQLPMPQQAPPTDLPPAGADGPPQ